MSKHTCPHYGQDGEHFNCGDHGYLCPACREDRADARTDRLVEGLRRAVLRELIWSNARVAAAALRGLEGGE